MELTTETEVYQLIYSIHDRPTVRVLDWDSIYSYLLSIKKSYSWIAQELGYNGEPATYQNHSLHMKGYIAFKNGINNSK